MIQRSDGSLEEHIECDGMDPDVIQNNKCSITIKSLLVSNFLLVQGEPIKATVEALNSIDFSTASDLSGSALVQVEPHTPVTAIQRGDETGETQVQIIFDN